ncbi:MAG: hypothetical protein ACT4PG_08520 [Panacagrimonas sp.]
MAAILGSAVLTPTAAARPKEFRGLEAPEAGRPPDSFIDRRVSSMSASQAAREAQMRYGGGRVLSVDPAGDGYRVKLLRDGDVRVVFIPNR